MNEREGARQGAGAGRQGAGEGDRDRGGRADPDRWIPNDSTQDPPVKRCASEGKMAPSSFPSRLLLLLLPARAVFSPSARKKLPSAPSIHPTPSDDGEGEGEGEGGPTGPTARPPPPSLTGGAARHKLPLPLPLPPAGDGREEAG